ncbi:MAG: hypothetical protein U9R00_02820 [Patescibacteria group bacterium]|nr:hypothetical protein [Patescibacteria group bacterium]
MKKSKTIIKFTFFLIVMLVTISIFVFSLKVIQNKNKHINAVYSTIQEKKERKEKSDLIKENIDEIKQSRDLIDSYFVDTENINLFIDTLEKAGKERGSSLEVVNVEVDSNDKRYILVTLNIFGRFSNVVRTIKTIEYLPYKIHVKNLYLNKDIDSEKILLTWQANMTFSVLSSS